MTRRVAKAVFASIDTFRNVLDGPHLLIYHLVGADLDLQMNTTVRDFEAQLGWIMENYEVVDLATAISASGGASANRMAVVTVDDGYENTHTTVFPVLEALGLPFTLYVATASVSAATPYKGIDPITWDQIGEMMESGLATLGAHTHSHADLRRLSSDGIAAEFDMSDDLIEANLGMRPRHFAYPWGYWSEAADALVRTRYESAVLGGRAGRVSMTDPHMLYRHPVQRSDGLTFFRSRLKRGLISEERVRRLIRRYNGP